MNEPVAHFTKFCDSAQTQDIKASKGPQDTFFDYIRVKEYVKQEDLEAADRDYCGVFGIRSLEFTEPYTWMSHVLDVSWNKVRAVPLVQFSSCNLGQPCPYCFADNSSTDVVSKTVDEFCTDWGKVGIKLGHNGFRFSGGEPLLFQPWLTRFFDEGCIADDNEAIWIDTNLTIPPSDELLRSICTYGDDHVAFCGCFKSHLGYDFLPNQLDVLKYFLDAKLPQLFLYYPADAGMEDWVDPDKFRSFLDQLKQVNPVLPLRLTVLHIKYQYAQTQANTNKYVPTEGECLDCYIDARETLYEWLYANYSVDQLWIPPYQTELYGA